MEVHSKSELCKESNNNDEDDGSYYNGKVASTVSEYFGLAAKKNFWISVASSILPIATKVALFEIP